MLKGVTASLLLCLAILSFASASAAPQENDWAGYRFLLGDWVGEGDGSPGRGSGWCSFVENLQGKVIVRKNHAEYPPAGDRPAFAHDDLMVIYHEGAGKQAKASYFDSEGHIIQYAVTLSEDGKTLTFLSDATPSGQEFRLTYTKGDADTMRLKFEIAPPGKTSNFKSYIEATLHRKQNAGKTQK